MYMYCQLLHKVDNLQGFSSQAKVHALMTCFFPSSPSYPSLPCSTNWDKVIGIARSFQRRAGGGGVVSHCVKVRVLTRLSSHFCHCCRWFTQKRLTKGGLTGTLRPHSYALKVVKFGFLDTDPVFLFNQQLHVHPFLSNCILRDCHLGKGNIGQRVFCFYSKL